jgi:hypothetical protein
MRTARARPRTAPATAAAHCISNFTCRQLLDARLSSDCEPAAHPHSPKPTGLLSMQRTQPPKQHTHQCSSIIKCTGQPHTHIACQTNQLQTRPQQHMQQCRPSSAFLMYPTNPTGLSMQRTHNLQAARALVCHPHAHSLPNQAASTRQPSSSTCSSADPSTVY